MELDGHRNINRLSVSLSTTVGKHLNSLTVVQQFIYLFFIASGLIHKKCHLLIKTDGIFIILDSQFVACEYYL